MKQYRKKPIVIEAVQITQGNYSEIAGIDGVTVHCASDDEGLPLWHRLDYVMVKTLEGTMRGDLGDWIIRGVKGEVYPCKDDVFQASYDAADKEPA